MLVLGGIDEAGYGPMLGPLCVAASVFVLDEYDPASGSPGMWQMLRSCVCRSRSDKKRRIAIDDSKKLKAAATGRGHPLQHLERGVLSFHLTDHGPPEYDDDLFERLGVTVPAHPWQQSRTALPVGRTAEQIGISAARLKRGLERAGMHCAMLRCLAVDPADFNDLVAQTGSKASVNFTQVLRHIDAIWRRWPAEHPRIIVDRQGGRTHYLEDLQHAWPDAQIRILAEEDRLSRYRLDRTGSQITITFRTEADGRELPVALASMTAKYIRELLMIRLNRFFTAEMPELKPTAGYYQDARRYLRDVGPVIERLNIPRATLVRSL